MLTTIIINYNLPCYAKDKIVLSAVGLFLLDYQSVRTFGSGGQS